MSFLFGYKFELRSIWLGKGPSYWLVCSSSPGELESEQKSEEVTIVRVRQLKLVLEEAVFRKPHEPRLLVFLNRK